MSLEKLSIVLYQTGTIRIARSSNAFLNNDDNNHVVVTYDASATYTGIKIYMNGIRVETGSADVGGYTGLPDNNSDLTIGKYFTTYVNGKIGLFKAYDRVLTAQEIIRLYQSQKKYYR